jgi:formamidopyrimidine-DNA glycosylase
MEGRLTWEQTKHTLMRIEYVVPSLDTTEEGVKYTLCYNNHRPIGSVDIFTSEEEFSHFMSKIGPDMLTDDITPAQWMEAIRSPKIRRRCIAWFLTEQKYFSGIGNYLKSEILYQARVYPGKKLWELSEDEAARLFTVAREVIKLAYSYGGLTIKSYWSPSGRKGMFPTAVYFQDYDYFGNPVVRERFPDGRTTHWVPNVQIP